MSLEQIYESTNGNMVETLKAYVAQHSLSQNLLHLNGEQNPEFSAASNLMVAAISAGNKDDIPLAKELLVQQTAKDLGSTVIARRDAEETVNAYVIDLKEQFSLKAMRSRHATRQLSV